MLYAGESDRKEGEDIPLLHPVDIHQTFLCQSRGRNISIGALFHSQTHLNRPDSSNSNSRKLFLSSLYFHIKNGTFDLGKYASASDTYGVAVNLRGAVTAPVSTSERHIDKIAVSRVSPVSDDCINRRYYYSRRLFVDLVLEGPVDSWDENIVDWRKDVELEDGRR